MLFHPFIRNFCHSACPGDLPWCSPRFDGETNLLHPSVMTFTDKPPSRMSLVVLRLLSALGLTKVTARSQDGLISEATNLTILNVFLVRLGSMTEKRLVQTLLATQVCTFFLTSGLWTVYTEGWLCQCLTVRLCVVFLLFWWDMAWHG